jgi:phosphate transport system permease protein
MMRASIPKQNLRRVTDAVMTSLTAACVLFAVSILALILGYIAWRGFSSINLQFLIDTPKPVGEGGGIGNAITGTLMLLAIASAIGLPFGIATGIYLAEFGEGRFASAVRFVADTLTGVPSIVVGVFIYTLIVLPMKQFSTFAGAVSLALIMIPIVTRTTEEMIRLPAAASGIATGAMLAVARVSGETAPLLFTAFGSRFFNFHLDQPIASLTVQIYNYAISPYDEWHAQAWAATLVLMALILMINITVRFFTRQRF